MPFCAQVYEPKGEEKQKMDAVPHPVSLVFEGQKGRPFSQKRRALSFFGFLFPPPDLSCSASVSFSERGIQARRFPNGVEEVSQAGKGAF